MRRYRTPAISPVSAAAGCRHNGTTARLSPSFCGRRLLRVTGTSATSFPAAFHSPPAVDGLHVPLLRVVYGLSLDMGAEVVAALGVARCRTARCRSQKVLHQPPGNGPAKDTLYIPADGRKHLQAEGGKQDLYTYQAWGGGK